MGGWGCYDAERSGLYPTIQELAAAAPQNVGMYEFLLDLKRPLEDVVDYILGANIDFIFRGNLHFGREQSTPEFRQAFTQIITMLKAAKPTILVQGGTAQCIVVRADDLDPYTGQPLTEEQLMNMVLRDPNTGEPLRDPLGRTYVPDITKEITRDFVVGMAQREIDCGVDSVFFDDPYYGARRIGLPESSYDPYLLDIFQRTRDYAATQGKQLLITANNQFNILRLAKPDYVATICPGVDICTIGWAIHPETLELIWDIDYPTAVTMIKNKLGDIPIHCFMDYAWRIRQMPLTVFGSSPLTQQQRLIREMDTLARANGILPVYPLHICWEVIPLGFPLWVPIAVGGLVVAAILIYKLLRR